MKVVMDDNDKKYMENLSKCIESGENIPILLNRKDKKYYLVFECDDIPKANAFIYNLMYKITPQDTGINVKALNYSVMDKQSVIDTLEDTIRKINDL